MRIFSIMILLLWANAAIGAGALVVYDGELENGFSDFSWASPSDYDLSNISPVYNSATHSIRFAANNWGGLQFISSNTYRFSDYQNFSFYIHGGSTGGQSLRLVLTRNGVTVASFDVAPMISGGAISANNWLPVTLDFDNNQLTYDSFNGVTLMDWTGTSQSSVYIDAMQFNPRTGPIATGGTVNVNVNLSTNVRPIDPHIFGVNFGDATRNLQMGYTVRRWGGNAVTRYNWQGDQHSTASDWFFINEPAPNDPPADQFISEARTAGAQPLITIPTIGWTPINDQIKRWSFSVAKYGPQIGTEYIASGYQSWGAADAGNGECDPSINHSSNCVLYDSQNGRYHLINNDPYDTSIIVDQTFGVQWIAHLQSTFGTAANGGVKFFALDNEPMLWNSTHRDVHPNPATYDEIWNKAQIYAAAIKAQEPNAIVMGPVTWGYPDIFSSAKDAAECNCSNGNDRQAHGGLAFLAWYLQQVCANPLAGGAHLVDYLDLHYYPQGDAGASDAPLDAAVRLNALKELYDPTWISQSWIGTLGDADSNHYDKPNFIPRVQAWVNQYCPATKLAISEYNWGPDDTHSGAVAQAELLGILAREGVNMATRWVAPAANSRVEQGFRLFLNYDGAGSKVSGDSVSAQSSNVDQIGAYAFRLTGQRTMVLLTNKDTISHNVALNFDSTHIGAWSLYGFDANHTLAQTGSGTINGAALTLSDLPPMSANLLVGPDKDGIFADGFESR